MLFLLEMNCPCFRVLLALPIRQGKCALLALRKPADEVKKIPNMLLQYLIRLVVYLLQTFKFISEFGQILAHILLDTNVRMNN